MTFKGKILILFCLIALVFSMAGVSAADVNQTIFSDTSVLGSADGGTFTELQDKINNAEDGSTITLENNYTYDNSFKGEYISIAKNITVDGNGYTIDAKDALKIFNINATDVVLNNIVFVNAASNDGIGSAIYSAGDLTVVNCSFSRNFAEEGGAIYSDGSLIVEASNFTDNVAHWMGGGAIYANGDLTVSRSNFIGNDAPDWDHQGNIGGAIYSLSHLNVTYSYFANNTAGSVGEKVNNAIYAYAAYASIENSTFINNNVVLTKFSSGFDLNLNSSMVPVGQSVMISVEFYNKDIPGNVTIHINDDEKVVDIVNGSVSLVLSDLAPGTYLVNVTYPESEYWWESFEAVIFNVFDGSYVIEAPDLIKYYGDSERFVVHIYDTDGRVISGKRIIINIDGRDYARTTDDDGRASVAINLNSGKHHAIVKCDDSSINSSITVKSTVSGENITKIFRNATQYYAKFVDTYGNILKNTPVEFNINGIFYTRTTNASGVAKMNINLNPGEYVITAKNPNSTEMYSNLVTVLPNVVENSNLIKYYRNSSQYVIKILDNQGNPAGAGENVTFNINGVFYKRMTNGTGHVKLNINLNPGEYIVTANYKGMVVSNTIKVLSVIEAKDLNMVYRDGSKFEARILDGQGNPYPGQNVTFNINGVFYNRITDDSGIARLNINLMAGEYIITSSYNGLNVANKITIV